MGTIEDIGVHFEQIVPLECGTSHLKMVEVGL